MKNQNKNLEDIAGKREFERKKLEEKCKELVDKNNKLTEQVTGQSALQGAKHFIWDVLMLKQPSSGLIYILLRILLHKLLEKYLDGKTCVK